MTNRFDVRQTAALGLDNNATQHMRHADGLEPSPAPDESPRPGQDSGGSADGSADGSELPCRAQASPTTPNYRRSLFRR